MDPFAPTVDTSSNPLFGDGNAAPPENATPPQAVNTPPEATPPQEGVQAKSPIDKFNDVFQNKPVQTKKEEGKEGEESDANLNRLVEPDKVDLLKGLPDDKKLAELYKEVNFLPEGSEEKLQAALKGDAGALSDLLNSLGRNLMAQSVGTSLKANAGHLSNNLESIQKAGSHATQNSIRTANLSGSLLQKFPALNNANIKGQIDGVINQFLSARGGKSDQDLLADISGYIETTYNIGTQESKDSDKKETKDTEWF